MTCSNKYGFVFAILGVLTTSLPAWADIPPDDQCDASSLGKPCPNAIANDSSFQAGICKAAMCTRATPNGSMSYACYRCDAEMGTGGQSNAGADGTSAGGDNNSGGGAAGGTSSTVAGAPSAGGNGSGGSSGSASTAGTKSGSSGSPSESKASSDGGCSVSQAQGGAGALAGVVVALGAAALFRRRRHSRLS